ncbi:hypothetical protein T01_2218 [Trichinella spiralis]|uniref:Uncharacterized protein n=1 Tax=Trichinella spiralis TaxID=6334 RepID=A0A0V1BIA1_TRISP|nr:hypothetical protein T01_2218 [Trichinella spiralis]
MYKSSTLKILENVQLNVRYSVQRKKREVLCDVARKVTFPSVQFKGLEKKLTATSFKIDRFNCVSFGRSKTATNTASKISNSKKNKQPMTIKGDCKLLPFISEG